MRNKYDVRKKNQICFRKFGKNQTMSYKRNMALIFSDIY